MSSRAFAKELNPKLEFFQTPSSGRGIRAKESFKAGSVILEDSPYLYVSKSELHGKICDACLTQKDDLKRCSLCKGVYYCGQSCQKSAWKVHKRECKSLKKMPTFPSELFSEFARLMALQLRAGNTDEGFFENLVSHDSDFRQQKGEMFAHMLNALLMNFGVNERIERQALWNLFGKFFCNVYSITGPGKGRELGLPVFVGVGLYYLATFINHSCHPNCVGGFDGPKCIIRAVKDIQCGDELSISYCGLARPCHVRRQQLRNHYFFECQCSRCMEEERLGSPMNGLKCTNKECTNVVGLFPDSIEDTCGVCGSEIASFYTPLFLKGLHSEIDSTIDKLEHVFRQDGNVREALEMCEGLLTYAETFLQPTNYQVARIMEMAGTLCAKQGLWSKAVEYTRKCHRVYQICYPNQNDQHIGILMCFLGYLEIMLGQYDSALHTLTEAKKVFTICYGETHFMVKSADTLLSRAIQLKRHSRMQGRRKQSRT